MPSGRKHQTKAYLTTAELIDFGRRICGVSQPARVLEGIAAAIADALRGAAGDERVPAALLSRMKLAWEQGMTYGGLPKPTRRVHVSRCRALQQEKAADKAGQIAHRLTYVDMA